ncbi:MAG: hypothetical protein OXE94_09520 [Aestuariivita sp.]|nr:hypothetical protein [Aestuariivita sp.]MCY4201081.1 hypothetical protein [Aestuariivita sp.]
MEDGYYNLGRYSLALRTANRDCQEWFDRGLNWTYGYNHQEAVKCFRIAASFDDNCPMPWWGIAYASGPNYNLPWHVLDAASRATALAAAFDATQEALKRLNAYPKAVSENQRALIEALPFRYPQRDPIDDMRPWNRNFASAMREAYINFSGACDVCAIFAESLLNLTPWKMWDIKTGKPASGAETAECKRVLERSMSSSALARAHPGILHAYVHLMEMSATPEKALKAADQLRTLCPDAGHLVHMATHIYVLCGDYESVVSWNQRACSADYKFFIRNGDRNLYTGYRLHNYHFTIYGAMLLGRFAPAHSALQLIKANVSLDLLRIDSPPMADFFESYLALEPHVLVRFGQWEKLMAMSLPQDRELQPTLLANTHYARAVAFAATGRIAEAEVEECLFLNSKGDVPESRVLHNNSVRDLLEIATQTVRGEIAYRKGDFEQAFASLRQAVVLEDSLPYDEPWGWMQPTRHALGALLFEQGHIEDAEQMFREDLGLTEHNTVSRSTIHPDNVWALRGLHDCLKARDERTEIHQIAFRLNLALARADTAVVSPCFCTQYAISQKT